MYNDGQKRNIFDTNDVRMISLMIYISFMHYRNIGTSIIKILRQKEVGCEVLVFVASKVCLNYQVFWESKCL